MSRQFFTRLDGNGQTIQGFDPQHTTTTISSSSLSTETYLTSSSDRFQVLSIPANQTIYLPIDNGVFEGLSFIIVNNSLFTLTIDGIGTLPTNGSNTAEIIRINGVWHVTYL